MEYQKYKPSKSLENYIDFYWTLSSDNLADIYTARTYPDGCTNILFNFADPIHLDIADKGFVQNALPTSIYGNVTRFFHFKVSGRIDLFSVNFKPGGIFPVLQLPVSEFNNRAIDAKFASIDSDTTLFERLAASSDTESRIGLFEQFLIKKLLRFDQTDPVVDYSLNRITTVHGNTAIDTIVRETGISERQLERKFKLRVGISPKLLCQILRFKHVQNVLKYGSPQSLLNIAYDNGYFDHAHLTNNFRRFAGVTPSYFSQYLPYF